MTLLLVSTADALDPARATSQYIRDHWNSENGFPGGQIHSIAQTKDGYLWIGTDRGLVRFDGLNFVTIQESGPDMVPITHIIGLTTDAEGALAVRMEGPNLFRYHEGKFASFLPQYLLSNGITAMSRANDGDILLATVTHGAFRCSSGKTESLAAPPESVVISIAQTADGKVWLGTRDDGLFYLNDGQLIAVTKGLPDSKINSLLPTRDGRLWIGTDNGAALWDGSEISKSNMPPSLAHLQVLTMMEDHDSNVWIGTAGGLLRLNAKGVSLLEGLNSQSNGAISALFEDREGNLWIGDEQGLERLRDSAFVTYSISEGLPSESNGPVYTGPDERIWIAPSEGGLYWMKGRQVERVKNAGLPNDIVYSITGSKDDVWLGRQRGGLTHLSLRAGAFAAETYTRSDGLAQNSVYTVHEDRDGTIWAGTLSGGVSRLKHGQFTTYTMADGLGSNTVSSIEDSSGGTMWFATPGGLNQLSNGHLRTYTVRDGLPSDDVISLLEDSGGILWIGTEAGLAFFSSNHIHGVDELQKSLHEPVFGIAEDHNGSLWLATSSQVLRVNRERLLRGTLSDGDIREYELADGLQGTEGVRRDRSVVSDLDGHIWFSMNRGLSVVDPRRARNESAPAMPHVETISVDGSPVDLQGTVHIPKSHQRIVFSLAGLSLAVPDRVRFRYLLEGFDHGWSEPVATRQAIYTNLGPGSYRFRLVASNSDGVWNGQETTVSFRIEPAFWQTWWFQCSCVLALALVAWLLYRLRMHQITRQMNVRFEERLAERMRIAQELHDTLLQGFLSASMQLHVLTDQVPESSPAKPLLGRVLQLMGQVTEEGRNALRGLRSSVRDSHNLEQALSSVPQELAIQEEIAYRVIVDGQPRPLHPVIRDEVYRIGREALVNAFRHAHAGNIEVALEYTAGHLRVMVRDDGRGIDPHVLNLGREGHWGLAGMRERAERIGAKLRVLSRSASGTEVELTVPSHVAYQHRPGKGWRSRLVGLGAFNRLRKKWFAANRPSIAWSAPNQVIHLLAPRSLLRRVFPQPVKPEVKHLKDDQGE